MIIADTDFLSSFLKIERLHLIFSALNAKSITIAKAVLHELEHAPVQQVFLDALHSSEDTIIIQDVEDVSSENFGKGELESIALAKRMNALLLMDNRKAAQFAKEQGITVMSIPSFLLYCRINKILSNEELRTIISDLKEKDYYEFNQQVKQRLLQ